MPPRILPATQVTLTELKNRRGQVEQVAAVFLDRKTKQSFNFKTDCFFCRTKVDLEDQKRRQGDVFRVTTLQAERTVLQTCFERKDEWAEVVRARILHVHDLPAADAIYHQACSVNFWTKKQIPMQFASELLDVKKRKIDTHKTIKK